MQYIAVLSAIQMPRPRDFQIPLGFFEPGAHNAITDVEGVRVGQVTVTEPGPDGRSEIHTGVSCIWPHDGWPWERAVYAGTHVLNGNGDLIGINQMNEWGVLRSPILLTSSLAIGAVYDATAKWAAAVDEHQGRENFFMPVVSEVSDLVLSDNRRFPITARHVEAALAGASTEPPEQGAVGSGAGTICYELKGGVGSASRVLPERDGGWTVGAFVLTNYGARRNLTIAGVPVGPELDVPVPPDMPLPDFPDGSCIVVVATDAPLLPHQLRRIAQRGSLGLTRSGGFAGQSSGEITLAFSTATQLDLGPKPTVDVTALRDSSNPAFNPLFEATVEAVDEAVLNSLFEAETTTGFRGQVVERLPIEQTLEILARHRVLAG